MDFSFSENQTVEDINKVPQDFRGLYKQGTDGKYALNAEDEGVKSAVSAITRLNSALANERKNRPAKVDLSPLKDFGETPEDIAKNIGEKMAALEEAAAGSKEAKLNLDKVKEDLAKGFSKEKEQLTKRNEALTGQLHTLLVENAATAAISELKGVPELLLPFVKNHVKVIEEEGQFKVFVVDGANERRYSGTTGEPMSIKELVSEMKSSDKYARLFESDTASGGGTKPGAHGKGQQAITKKTGERELSAVEKISAGLAKGQATRGR